MIGGVFLGYLHPDQITASFVECLEDLKHHDARGSRMLREWGKVRAGSMGIPEARNTIVAQFLNTECEWLFFVDSDMGFAPDILDRLLSRADADERPVVGGLAFAYREFSTDGMGGFKRQPMPTILDWVPERPDGTPGFVGRRHYPTNELVKAGATGAAVLLIHRSVLERMQGEFGPVWFDRLPDTNGTLMGEDISFCARLGALEVPLYVDTGARTTHYKAIWVSEADFWQSYDPPPAREPVDVIVPTVKPRAHLIDDLAVSLRASTGLARLWFVVDDEEHAALCPDWAETIIEPGSFPHKINHAYKHIPKEAPWIMVVGDDCRFQPKWLDHAQKVAQLYGAKVIGTNDLTNHRVVAGDHATHWMIARDYIDEQGASWDGPGVVAHEGYHHNFVDDEIVNVAKYRGVFQSALGSIVKHYHPIAGRREADVIDEQNASTWKADQKLFLERMRKHAT